MASRGEFQITNSNKVDMTLTITMSVEEWRQIRKRLDRSNTNSEWYLDEVIGRMIDEAETKFRFYEEVGEKKL